MRSIIFRLLSHYNPGHITLLLGILCIVLADRNLGMLGLPAIVLGLNQIWRSATFGSKGILEPFADVLAAFGIIHVSEWSPMFAILPFVILNQITRENRSLLIAIAASAIGGFIAAEVHFGFKEIGFVTGLTAALSMLLIPALVDYRVRRTLEFMAGLRHEMRTPIGNSLSALDKIQRMTVLPPLANEMVAEMQLNLRYAAAVLDNILEYSKSLAKQLTVRSEPMSLPKVVSLVVKRFSGTIKNPRHFNVIFSGERLCIDSSDDFVRSILTNLVSNALKHAGDDAWIQVIISTTPIDKSKVCVRLVVSDTGPGVDPLIAGRLFESFASGRTSRSDEHRSTGMGLALVRDLAGKLRGKATWTPVEPMGSRFAVEFRSKIVDRSQVETDYSFDQLTLACVGAPEIFVMLANLALGKSTVPTNEHIDDALVRLKVASMNGPAILLVHFLSQMNFESVAELARQRAPGIILMAVFNPVQDCDLLTTLNTFCRWGYSALLPRDTDVVQLEEMLTAALSTALWHPHTSREAMAPAIAGTSTDTRPVLLVEDERLMREHCRAILTEAGFEVVALKRGDEALYKLASSGDQYSVAVLDYNLPGAKADQIVAHLRSNDSTLPVIIITAAASGNRVDDAALFAPGTVEAVLAKPINEIELLEHVMRHARPSNKIRNQKAAIISHGDQSHLAVSAAEMLDDDGKEELLTYFCRAVPNMIALARQELAAGHMEPFIGHLHRLKNTMHVMNETRLREYLDELEVKKDQPSEDWITAIEVLEELCFEAIERHSAAVVQ